MLRRPTTSPLFPYTTLFRSIIVLAVPNRDPHRGGQAPDGDSLAHQLLGSLLGVFEGDVEKVRLRRPGVQTDPAQRFRSEEHTSELQSRFDLVCRLLLEKKKL